MPETIEKLKELQAQVSEPLKATREIEVFDGKVKEEWHVFVAGLRIYGDGSTLDEALQQLRSKIKK